MYPKPDEKLIEAYLQNTCTPEEATTVLKWLSTPEGHEFLESRIEKDIVGIDNGDEYLIDHEVRSAYIYQKINDSISSLNKPENILRIRSQWLKIAAAIFIPLLVANAVLWHIFTRSESKPEWQEVYVPKGEKLQVMFQDGSKVWLNSDSHLKYPVAFTGSLRQVNLDGEAYFVVKKNPRKPFIVHLANLDVKVTGTSFNVKAYNDENNITTTLDEGKVSLLLKHGTKPEYILKPSQQAIYSKGNGQVSIMSSVNGQNSTWKENKIVFNDTPLPEVIKILERWYNVKFATPNPKLPLFKYTISFKNETLQNVLFGLEQITPVHFEMKNGIVEIRKKD
ncbi:MAG: DUF4974 domain-containing protein [Bacteroidota bacterium]|nr:DUF4974 domain-containing protein [Bacteroidota bacterium]